MKKIVVLVGVMMALCVSFTSFASSGLDTDFFIASDSDAEYVASSSDSLSPAISSLSANLMVASTPSPFFYFDGVSQHQLNYTNDAQSQIYVPSNALILTYHVASPSYERQTVSFNAGHGAFSDFRYDTLINSVVYSNVSNSENHFDSSKYFFSTVGDVGIPRWYNWTLSRSGFYITDIKNFYNEVYSLPNYSIGGVYTSSDAPLFVSNVWINGRSAFTRSVWSGYSDFFTYKMTGDGILKEGYTYTFNFYSSFDSSCSYGFRTDFGSNEITFDDVEKSGNNIKFTLTPSFDLRLSDLLFVVGKGSRTSTGSFYYISSRSDYIPASNTDEINQNINKEVTNISNVVTNISNTITNVSNQISNMTTTITNTITNMANQISGALGQQTDSITSNADQNTDKVTNNANQNTEKVTNNANQNTDKVTANADENTGKVTEKLEDVKTGIINGIIEGLKNLFIPSDEFFKSYFDDLYEWFSERLGFLSFPIDLLVKLVDMFIGSSSTDCILTIPTFSISGHQLWGDMPFNFTSFLNEHFKFVLDAIQLVTSIGLVFGFVGLCDRKWNEVMMN